MKDAAAGLAVLLRYRVFPREDVIVRSAVIRNEGDAPLRDGKAREGADARGARITHGR